MSISRLSKDTSADNVCEIIERDGCVIIEDMVSQEQMDSLIADLRPSIDRTPFGDEGFSGNRTRRTSALFAKSFHTAALVEQPLFMAAAEEFLAHEFPMMSGRKRVMVKPTIQISVTQAIEISPGQPAQDIHRDDGMYHTLHPGPDSLLQTLYAATTFTIRNGATMAIPGSHKWDMDRLPKVEEAVPAEMRRGSGLMYVGSIYHGGGANRTKDERRLAIAISLTQGHRRQEENQYLVVPLEIVRQYPKHIQDLLGYKISTPYCGWVEMNEPSIVLDAGTDFRALGASSFHNKELEQT